MGSQSVYLVNLIVVLLISNLKITQLTLNSQFVHSRGVEFQRVFLFSTFQAKLSHV